MPSIVCLRLTGAVARRRPTVDVGRRIPVVAGGLIGAVRLLHRDHRAERNHRALRVPHLELRDVVGRGSELRVRLHLHLVGAAELVEVVHVHRPEIGLHGLEQVGEDDAFVLHLVPIHLDVELGHVDPVAAEDPRQLGRLIRLAEERLGGVVERGLAQAGAVLQLQLESADLAEAVDRRRREDGHEGVLNAGELGVERARDVQAVLVLPVPLVERLEGEEDDARVRRVHEAVDREAGELHGVLDAWLLAADLRHLADDLLGAIQRRRVGELGEGHQVLLVLRRHEAARHLVEAETR